MPTTTVFILRNCEYAVEKLLGKGKSGYSYLVRDEDMNPFTIKKIHHEKCDFYQFPEDKLGLEVNHYEHLRKIGIRVPMLLDYDRRQDIILKEFIEGPSILDLIIENKVSDDILEFMQNVQSHCRNNNINIDYCPSNFIVARNGIFYVDYEINEYSDTWNFDNWGKKYFDTSTEEFRQLVRDNILPDGTIGPNGLTPTV